MRISYWTTAPLEPRIEAVSQEVADLARHFDGRIFAVNPHLALKLERRGRTLGFNPAFDPLLRLLLPVLELRGDLNHVYSEPAPWLFHKGLRRRPIVFTIASEKGAALPEFLERCAYVVAQTAGMARRLADQGVDPHRISLIYPGVDLRAMRPRAGHTPGRDPRILLATFPRTQEELAERGVLLLLETARLFPRIQFTLLSRPWRGGSTALAEAQRRVAASSLRNVTILQGVQEDMRAVYLQHDFTVIPFTTPGGGKECPRSLVETLACGVPALISDAAPFAGFVRAEDCGEVFAPVPESLAAAVERACSRYALLAERSAHCARAHFDVCNTTRAYAALYDRLS